MKYLGIIFIRAYQLCIKPVIGGVCRFTPTCSEYAAQALTKHGFCKGTWLALKRILKCHPRHPGGCDDVP